jgi:hypothetical protein
MHCIFVQFYHVFSHGVQNKTAHGAAICAVPCAVVFIQLKSIASGPNQTFGSTLTVQPLVSGSLPHWIPVRVSYSFWVRGPILPPLMLATLPSQSSSLTGLTTAAVPVPNVTGR